jgi:hypothetical protein
MTGAWLRPFAGKSITHDSRGMHVCLAGSFTSAGPDQTGRGLPRQWRSGVSCARPHSDGGPVVVFAERRTREEPSFGGGRTRQSIRLAEYPWAARGAA